MKGFILDGGDWPPDWVDQFLSPKERDACGLPLQWLKLLDEAPMPAIAHHCACRMFIAANKKDGPWVYFAGVRETASRLKVSTNTVMHGIAILVELGWIVDTGERRRQAIVYSLSWPECPDVMVAWTVESIVAPLAAKRRHRRDGGDAMVETPRTVEKSQRRDGGTHSVAMVERSVAMVEQQRRDHGDRVVPGVKRVNPGSSAAADLALLDPPLSSLEASDLEDLMSTGLSQPDALERIIQARDEAAVR